MATTGDILAIAVPAVIAAGAALGGAGLGGWLNYRGAVHSRALEANAEERRWRRDLRVQAHVGLSTAAHELLRNQGTLAREKDELGKMVAAKAANDVLEQQQAVIRILEREAHTSLLRFDEARVKVELFGSEPARNLAREWEKRDHISPDDARAFRDLVRKEGGWAG